MLLWLWLLFPDLLLNCQRWNIGFAALPWDTAVAAFTSCWFQLQFIIITVDALTYISVGLAILVDFRTLRLRIRLHRGAVQTEFVLVQSDQGDSLCELQGNE
jgi:hypothetical protein